MESNEQVLTPAWSPIRERRGIGLTGQRKAYHDDDVRFKVVAAGRRSTKTLIAKRRLVKALVEHLLIPPDERPAWFKDTWRYFYGAPTQDQANEIAWQSLIDLTPPEWVKKIYRGSKPVIKTIWNSEIHVIGMDEARRVEGQPWNGGVLDEFPDMKAGVWEANLLPILADRDAWLLILGVPDYEKPNNDKFKELYDKGLSGDPDWRSYTWWSEEVLSEAAIKMLEASMSPKIARQELRASWESAPGLAYPDFNVKNVKKCPFDNALPLLVGCDFNRKHHTWGIYQYHDGAYHILEDLYVPNATVEVMALMLRSRTNELKPQRIEFYGDYSGSQLRAEATLDSWRQIKAQFPEAFYGVKPQPRVNDRIEKANAFICNAAEERRLFCDPVATVHKKDFEKVSRVMAFAGDGGVDGELTHASSALGYTIWQHQQLLVEVPQLPEPILFF